MDMSLQFALVIIIVTYLRRTLQTKTTMPVWHKRLSIILFAAIGCMVLQLSVASFSTVLNILFVILEDILVGLLLYIIYKYDEFVHIFPPFEYKRFIYKTVPL